MGAARKLDLNHRLEGYFATLRSSSLRETLKRSAGNWQLYAAVTGSAMAMATSASASIIGSGIRDSATDPIGSARTNNEHIAAFTNAVQLAMARQDSRDRFLNGAVLKTGPASQAQAPSIPPGGVVPLDGTASVIQPGELVSIYGSNLASGTAMSNGDFPTSLGGTHVEINGKAAFLLFVSPGQINLQAPDDTARGTVSVVVTTSAGSATSTVTLSQFAPAFALLDAKHVSGIILRPNHKGAYGGGSYDVLGPTGSSFGYRTMAAQVGDTVELYGVGFGPTSPAVPAGHTFSGIAPVLDSISLYINNVFVKPTFVGLSSAGLYQINLTVPRGLGEGDVPIQAVVGGMQTQMGVLFSLRNGSTGSTYPVAGSGTNPGGTFFGTGGTGAGPGGSGTGGSGGSGGGSGGGSFRPVIGNRSYEPRLRFGAPREG